MKLHAIRNRLSSRINPQYFRSARQILVLLLCFALRPPLNAQQPDASPFSAAPLLSTEEVVQNLVRMNSERAQALRAYHGTRTYRMEYNGFPGTRSAEMAVEVKYESPGTKEFLIQSATGSKLVIDKVFKKLLQAEQEALEPQTQRRTALNRDNYDFTLVGYESTPAGSMYVLIAEPRRKDKFLYRGRLWVDATDFAVVRLKAEPAKNPSFWTKNTEVEQVYTKVSDFWLPVHNRSVSAIRLGGRAELTIEYNNYQITGADPVGNLSMLEPTRSADSSRAQRLGDHR